MELIHSQSTPTKKPLVTTQLADNIWANGLMQWMYNIRQVTGRIGVTGATKVGGRVTHWGVCPPALVGWTQMCSKPTPRHRLQMEERSERMALQRLFMQTTMLVKADWYIEPGLVQLFCNWQKDIARSSVLLESSTCWKIPRGAYTL